MYVEAIAEYNPLAMDVVLEYETIRRQGYSREDALSALEKKYENELMDFDCEPMVRVGLAIALCQKKELIPEVKKNALSAIEKLILRNDWGEEGNRVLKRAERTLSEERFLGDEAVYKPRRMYVPDWKTGDTFAHTLIHPDAKKYGMQGWTLLLRKTGDYIDNKGRCVQLVYLSLCRPDQLPKNSEEMNSLKCILTNGFLWQRNYLGSMSFKNRSDEKSYLLEKIGNFPDIRKPQNQTDNSPFAARHFENYSMKNGKHVNFEQDVFYCIGDYGFEELGRD